MVTSKKGKKGGKKSYGKKSGGKKSGKLKLGKKKVSKRSDMLPPSIFTRRRASKCVCVA
jgi:hypothetical protein